MTEQLEEYHLNLTSTDKEICELLAMIIEDELTESEFKIWHAHPVWFLAGNPIVGYSKQKRGIKLMFWSGADFDELDLQVRVGKFKDASIFYQNCSEIDRSNVTRWLKKSREIQWDYKNLVKKRGLLERLS